jgi:RNA polymerase sigma-70 factor (ECF subfamily)
VTVERQADTALAEVVRREAGRIVATIHRQVADFDVAEEAVHDAVLSALRSWRRDGVPDRPGAWLVVAARRNAIDILRRNARQDRLAQSWGGDQVRGSAEPVGEQPPDDDRLPLLFACCHPSLAVEARIALTLRAVVGLTTSEIARAFLVPESTLAQRIVRAKRKIVQAGIPLRVPDAEQLPARLDDVLTVACLSYNAGYLRRPPTDGESGGDGDERRIAADAVWLSGLVAKSLPAEPEAWGLLALLTLLDARAPARFDERGGLVLLPAQDRTRWDRGAIAAADVMLGRAAAMGRTGRYQLQAAIAACHTAAPTWEETDWLQIVTLYDLLVRRDPSPVVRLNRAVALSHLEGPAAALQELDRFADALSMYHLLHSTRGYLLRALGRDAEAADAYRTALRLATNPVEQDLLRTRIGVES